MIDNSAEHRMKQLLGLMMIGCYLEGRDGHIWIEEWFGDGEDEFGTSGLAARLKRAGILLNNKIYGGVLEALDTIDEALRLAQSKPLAELYDPEYGLFLGRPGFDRSRIDQKPDGHGGLY